jgi:hypothetical protein
MCTGSRHACGWRKSFGSQPPRVLRDLPAGGHGHGHGHGKQPLDVGGTAAGAGALLGAAVLPSAWAAPGPPPPDLGVTEAASRGQRPGGDLQARGPSHREPG